MAVVELGAAERVAARATYVVEKQTTPGEPTPGFRLPPERQRDLRDLFFQVESQMGIKSSFFSSLDTWAGVRSPRTEDGEAPVKLVGAERWCNDRREESGSARARVRYARCRAALVALAPLHRQVIFRAYGPRDPFPFGEFQAEIAPIVAYTPLVEEIRCATRDRLVLARLEGTTAAAHQADARTRGTIDAMAASIEALRAALAPWRAARAHRLEVVGEWRAVRGEMARLRKLLKKPSEDARQHRELLDLKTREASDLRERAAALREEMRQLLPDVKMPGELRQIEARLAGAKVSLRHLPDAESPAVRDHAERMLRKGADAEVTRMSVVHAALHPHEGKDSASRHAAAVQRRDFVARAIRQANALLAKASVEYQLRWWELGTPAGAP